MVYFTQDIVFAIFYKYYMLCLVCLHQLEGELWYDYYKE